jgi:hypothetical protein
MLVLVPFKPIAIVIGLLAALIFCGYVASSYSQGKNPFSEDYWKAKQAENHRNASQPAPRPAH